MDAADNRSLCADVGELESLWMPFVDEHPCCRRPVRFLLDEAARYAERNEPVIVQRDARELETLRDWAERPEFRNPPGAGLGRPRAAGELVTMRVYDIPGDYASFPSIQRDEKNIVLSFMVQPVALLRGWRRTEWNWHPHGQQFSTPCFAVSEDEGRSWHITRRRPEMGRIIQSTRGHEAWTSETPAPEKTGLPEALGGDVHPFDCTRCADGSLLAAAYGRIDERGDGNAPRTTFFARSVDGARTWRVVSHLPPLSGRLELCDYAEPALHRAADGTLVCMLRTEWRTPTPEDIEPQARNKHDDVDDGREPGYGWYFYQCMSTDNGASWSPPEPTDIWGHPAHIIRLNSGQALMVYGHRRAPWSIRAVLSHDDGRTWDARTARILHEFKPSLTDIGYPVATQFGDGAILCAFYGYTTDQVDPWGHPHGVFVTLFDEEWMRA